MKIAIDARIWRKESGGVGRYARNLVTELTKIDHENEYTVIITPEDEKDYDIRASNFKKLIVDIPHYSVPEQRQLPKILNAGQFDLVHFTHFNHPILYRRPFVVTIHDLIMHLFPSGKQTKSSIYKAAYRMVMRDAKRAKKIIVPSVATKNDLVSMLKFPVSKIVVTPEGSEAAFREHSEQEIIAVKERLRLPKKYLLFVSRWEHYKGLPALLRAYDELKKEFPDLGLVICGRPVAQSPQVEAMVRDRQKADDKIITPGFVDDQDLVAIYSAATVYVHPSWYEGFGIMILEAFASGAPVVTSDTSSLPEVVGDAGLLVDPKNIDELTDAIGKVLRDPELANDLKEKGLARVKQFSWAKMAAETLEVYRQALD